MIEMCIIEIGMDNEIVYAELHANTDISTLKVGPSYYVHTYVYE